MSAPHMTPRERVFAALARRSFDRYPVLCPTSVANIDSMRLSGTCFPKAHTDVQQMADLAAVSHTILGFDSVMPYFSVHLEAAALGCEVYWGDGSGGMPIVTKKALRHWQDFELPKNLLEKAPCKALLRAIRLLRQRLGPQVVIIGKVVGPWTLAYHLYGVENLMLDTILEPTGTRQFIEALLPVSLEFARAQYEAGADIITWADHTTADIISAGLYEELMFPIHKKAAACLQGYGPMVLHTCGNIMDRLDLICQTGFSLFHIDSRNNIKQAVQTAGDRILLTGAVNNPSTLVGGNRADIYEEVCRNIEAGITLISPECAVPFKVTNQSLQELAAAAHRQKPVF